VSSKKKLRRRLRVLDQQVADLYMQLALVNEISADVDDVDAWNKIVETALNEHVETFARQRSLILGLAEAVEADQDDRDKFLDDLADMVEAHGVIVNFLMLKDLGMLDEEEPNPLGDLAEGMGRWLNPDLETVSGE
jgi:hypothetical protein